jgi:hypothetical protein
MNKSIDVNDKMFISYSRKRIDEVKKIAERLDLLGIPCWQDINDLGHEQTGQEITRILGEESLAGALVFLTPEFKNSVMIRAVEAPLIVERKRGDDHFVFVPVLHHYCPTR